METLDSFSSKSELTLSPRAQSLLLETAKWANFLSIVGFVMLGIIGVLSLFGLFAAVILGGVALLGALIYVGIIVLYFFPTMYLFNFAKKTREMITHQNQITSDEAFEYLKSFFKFMGILTIVTISLYIILLIVVGGTGMMYRSSF